LHQLGDGVLPPDVGDFGPVDLPTAVEVVTAARPERPEVWYSRKPPTKATTMTIQIHFA